MKKYYLFLLLLVFSSCEKDEIIVDTPTPIKELKSISIQNRLDTLIISHSHQYNVTALYSDGSKVDISNDVSIESDSKLYLKDKKVYGAKSGTSIVNIKYKTLQLKDTTYVSEVEYGVVNSKLIPKPGFTNQVNVICINFFPTNDGINLDMNRAPDDFFKLNNSTLDYVKGKLLEDVIITKESIEEGTRFRDYGRNVTPHYVGINVVKYITIYEADMVNWFNDNVGMIKTIDYYKLFEKLKIKELVELNNVKEIWFNHYPKNEYPSVVSSGTNNVSTYWGIPESKMSTPHTGYNVYNAYPHDINVPTYSKTYVIYGFSLHRDAALNLHNRGHQIEAQLNHIERNRVEGRRLFRDDFCGYNRSINGTPRTRCGDTHHPPNSNQSYDYNESEIVKSDIMTWKPEGGTFVDYSSSTHMGVKYGFNTINSFKTADWGINNYKNNQEFMWHIFWSQSIPGMNNNIEYTKNDIKYKLRNWWEIFYNWDEVVTSNKTLWVE